MIYITYALYAVYAIAAVAAVRHWWHDRDETEVAAFQGRQMDRELEAIFGPRVHQRVIPPEVQPAPPSVPARRKGIGGPNEAALRDHDTAKKPWKLALPSGWDEQRSLWWNLRRDAALQRLHEARSRSDRREARLRLYRLWGEVLADPPDRAPTKMMGYAARRWRDGVN
ncbi:hypothetical protein NOR51B_399 [Luminiphilus syltensis NOR5-1B]|uniref:Uncharacterized protein n=1 Tax=Luminiphilus syltensis NOR5-1B TaxID=565045 RepID=B8KVR6_9GAMM|nr:hypothetical protein [Luminiphilus syltensis]EED34462.1 hypothetical protein NOR51B_399 [Luminiphilus syltensis NOR5-1B]